MKSKLLMLAPLLLAFSQTANSASLDWLVGCWESPDGSSIEVWVQEQDGSLSGFSAALNGNTIAFYEVLRITQAADDTIAYTAHPAGQSSTTFKAAKTTGNEVTFSNASHDYPQEIRYKREGDKLYASISALNGENPRSFNKQSCQ